MVAEEHRLGYYGYGSPHYYGGHYRRPHYYQPRYQHGYYRGRRSTDEVTYPEPSAADVSDADQNTEEYRRGYYGGYYRPRYAGYYGYRPYFYGRPHWAY